ncbi:hypothetical protein ZIOFF_008975 [Zingiber officinale]|uniref:Uncharacterized protein n=1 Tax=Zingiber officinale TaxID=94328 RepID=A0A8J5HH04_ZINOF|nr:hypothetical protein ZIOFF_008975 [Zingiber officinale]
MEGKIQLKESQPTYLCRDRRQKMEKGEERKNTIVKEWLSLSIDINSLLLCLGEACSAKEKMAVAKSNSYSLAAWSRCVLEYAFDMQCGDVFSGFLNRCVEFFCICVDERSGEGVDSEMGVEFSAFMLMNNRMMLWIYNVQVLSYELPHVMFQYAMLLALVDIECAFILGGSSNLTTTMEMAVPAMWLRPTDSFVRSLVPFQSVFTVELGWIHRV